MDIFITHPKIIITNKKCLIFFFFFASWTVLKKISLNMTAPGWDIGASNTSQKSIIFLFLKRLGSPRITPRRPSALSTVERLGITHVTSKIIHTCLRRIYNDLVVGRFIRKIKIKLIIIIIDRNERFVCYYYRFFNSLYVLTEAFLYIHKIIIRI